MIRLIALSAVLIGVQQSVSEVRRSDRRNVCRSFRDYASISNNRNCFYNPDADLTPVELASRYGCTLSTHEVTTEDGYILSMFRLNKKGITSTTPVILQHGILVDGVSWLVSGQTALGFTFANAGFDVWLPNLRGTQFSYKHVKSGISEKEYWNFSFHEMSVYDTPAFVEKIAEITNKTENDIAYVGHSMGGTIALVYASLKKQHADKYLKGMILMAPAAYLGNLRGAPRLLAPLALSIKSILESVGIYSIGNLNRIQRLILKRLCGTAPLISICQIVTATATGLVVEQIRPEVFPVILSDFPNGCSLKVLNHYVQINLNHGRFQQYDYGNSTNLAVYNSTVPPEYPVGEIALPTHIVYGEADFFVSKKDAEILYNRLNCSKNIHRYKIAHNDFAYGKHVKDLYGDFVKIIKQGFSVND